MLYIGRKNVLLEKGLHHFFEIIFPFGAMRLCLMRMLVPGMQVRKLVHGCHQEGVRVKIVIDGDAMALAIVRRAVVAKFTVAVSRDFKLAFKVVDPPADERGGIGRKIGFKNFNFIQFLPQCKDKVLQVKGERLKAKDLNDFST